MKKIVSILFMFCCLMVTLPSQAQVRFGVKGGLNITKLDFKESTFDSGNKTGWFLGPMVDFKLPVIGLGIDAAALYSQNDLAVSTSKGEATLEQKTLECPINIKYNFGLGNSLGFYLAAGPQFGFNIGDKDFGEFVDDFKLKDSEVTFNIGGGVRLIDHLQVGVGYNFSISEVNKDNKYEVNKNTWQVTAAFLF